DVVSPLPESLPTPAEPGFVAPNVVKYHDGRGRSRRSRRNRLRGKRYDEAPHPTSELRPSPRVVTPEVPQPDVQEFPSVLPGESLAKYQKPVAVSLEDTSERQESSRESAQMVENSDLAPAPFGTERTEAIQTRPSHEPSSQEISEFVE